MLQSEAKVEAIKCEEIVEKLADTVLLCLVTVCRCAIKDIWFSREPFEHFEAGNCFIDVPYSCMLAVDDVSASGLSRPRRKHAHLICRDTTPFIFPRMTIML
jgi:hypothetical protein